MHPTLPRVRTWLDDMGPLEKKSREDLWRIQKRSHLRENQCQTPSPRTGRRFRLFLKGPLNFFLGDEQDGICSAPPTPATTQASPNQQRYKKVALRSTPPPGGSKPPKQSGPSMALRRRYAPRRAPLAPEHLIAGTAVAAVLALRAPRSVARYARMKSRPSTRGIAKPNR